jgi:ferric-dicitrate binding protein FerR (iron transport regulator)
MSSLQQSARLAITQIAAEWFTAHRAGPLSQSQREEFLAWLKASPVHIEEYLGVAALERAFPEVAKSPTTSLSSLIELGRNAQDSNVAELISKLSPAGPPGMQRIRLWWGVAALFSLSAAGLCLIWALREGILQMPGFGPQTYMSSHQPVPTAEP